MLTPLHAAILLSREPVLPQPLCVPSPSSKLQHAISSPNPRFVPPAPTLRKPHSQYTPLPSPTETNAATSLPPTKSLPRDWRFPSLQYPAPNHAPVHTTRRDLPRSRKPADPAIRQ